MRQVRTTSPISYTPKMMEPGFERLPLQDMVRAFADGFGVGDEFPRSDDEVIARLLSDSLFTSQGITVERIKEEVTVPYRTGTFWVRAEGWTTPTKKLEFYCEGTYADTIRMENESEMTEEYMDRSSQLPQTARGMGGHRSHAEVSDHLPVRTSEASVA